MSASSDPRPDDVGAWWRSWAEGAPSLEHLMGCVSGPWPAPTAFLDKVDASPYAWEDWRAALAVFHEWLGEKGITARPLESMLGYIECCTLASPSALAPPALAALVLRMLDDYGFDAGQAASPDPS